MIRDLPAASVAALSIAGLFGLTSAANAAVVLSNSTTSSATSMAGTTFVFYAENDLFRFNDGVADFSGSIAGDDLNLFMFDSEAVSGGVPGLTVRMSAQAGIGAELTAFGSGITGVSGSDFMASLTGSYDTQPEPPMQASEPATLALLGLGLAGVGLGRRKALRR